MKPEIPVISIRTARILLSVLYTILIQMEIPLYHLKIKTRIVLNGMKIKEFYVLCVDICD